MATRRTALALVLVLLAPCLGCASSYLSREVSPTAAAPANAWLHLSNQSTEQRIVTMSVYVDGALRLRRSMRSVFADSRAAHGFPDEIPMRLSPGSHTIRVVAEGKGADAETEVVVGGVRAHVDAAYHFFAEGCGERPARTGTVEIRVTVERPGYC
jgi:hypothetical protein